MQHPDASRLMDLSLRHLPDVSDASMTFQIPFDAASATRLIDEVSQDFLRGFDDSLSTPMHPRAAKSPLTLEELTPRRQKASELVEAMSSSFVPQPSLRRSPRKTKRLPRDTAATEASKPRGFEDLTREVQGLLEEVPADGSFRSEDFFASSPQKRYESPAAPALRRSPRKLTARNLLNIVPTRIHPEKPLAKSKPEMKIAPIEPTREEPLQSQKPPTLAVERLLGYGAILIGEQGNDGSEASQQPATKSVTSDASTFAAPSRDLAPLTLSQLSPHKSDGDAEHASADAAIPPPSPMRPSRKRSNSPVTDLEATRDKAEPGLATGMGRSKRVKTVGPSIAKKPIASSSRLPLKLPPGKQMTLRGRRLSSINRNHGLPSSSRKPGTSATLRQAQDQKRAKPKPKAEKQVAHGPVPLERPGRTVALHLTTGTLPAAKPTKPVGFHFQLDARMEARKLEFQARVDAAVKRPPPHQPLPVPNFQTLHAAQRDLDASRRDHVAPSLTVPVSPQLHTQARTKERERFEAARKAREREIELQKEERMRQQALEDEKEIRELRRQAVPRANEIPEWYANAPKRQR